MKRYSGKKKKELYLSHDFFFLLPTVFRIPPIKTPLVCDQPMRSREVITSSVGVAPQKEDSPNNITKFSGKCCFGFFFPPPTPTKVLPERIKWMMSLNKRGYFLPVHFSWPLDIVQISFGRVCGRRCVHLWESSAQCCNTNSHLQHQTPPLCHAATFVTFKNNWCVCQRFLALCCGAKVVNKY